MFLSVVIPAFNENENLRDIIGEIKHNIAASGNITQHEIIVVDDHSSDDSFDTIQRMTLPGVKCIRLSRRSGSHVALRAGIRAAKGDAVLCISADGQDHPEAIGRMVAGYKAGNDIIWALRKKRQEGFSAMLFANFFYNILKSVTDQEENTIDLNRADFFMLSHKAADAVNACNERNTSLFGLLVWLGFKQDFTEYDRRPRKKGSSKWSFRSKMHLAKDWIIAFSGIPLKIMTYAGFTIALCGFLYALFIILYSLMGYARPGWAETVIITLLLGGIQMIMLGIIGEYLWRNLDETRKRPLYFVEADSSAEEKR